jgi:hypothetical protein
MGDSFYHIFTTPYLFFLTLLFKWRGVGIHDVITKIYHMSAITLISGKICDKIRFRHFLQKKFFEPPPFEEFLEKSFQFSMVSILHRNGYDHQ